MAKHYALSNRKSNIRKKPINYAVSRVAQNRSHRANIYIRLPIFLQRINLLRLIIRDAFDFPNFKIAMGNECIPNTQDNENVVIALYDYNGSTDEELSLQAGQELIVLNDENDDWWYVTNSSTNQEGYAPSTFLRYKNASPLKDQPIQEDNEDDNDSATESNSSNDEEYEEEERQSPNTEDDLLSVIKQQKLEQLRRRSSMRTPQGHKLIAPEIFKEMEIFPHGFRYSTLARNKDMG